MLSATAGFPLWSWLTLAPPAFKTSLVISKLLFESLNVKLATVDNFDLASS